MSMFRQSRHPLVRWWWEMDRITVLLFVLIMLVGAVAVTTASVAVSKTYDVGAYYFAVRHYLFLTLAFAMMMAMSTLNPQAIKSMGVAMFGAAYIGILLTFIIGTEVKGGRRWINLAGQNIQPSEFMKPALIILTAALLERSEKGERLKGFLLSMVLAGAVGLPVLLQPNFGMVLAMGTIWFFQVFMAGMPLLWLLPLMAGGLCLVVVAYTFFPHVRDRIEKFINPENSDTYQVDQAMEAISSGHLWGRGAGEGVVKQTLPDAHTDFIFAVVVEEFGIVLALFLMMLYLGLMWRGFKRIINQEDRFVMLAGGGFLTLFSIHVCVNIGVATQVLPTTGMTLPFISYGGSSTIAMALSAGFLLALLRKKKSRM